MNNVIHNAMMMHQIAVKNNSAVEQSEYLIEEMAELTQALQKAKRGFDNRDNILEELADVQNMLNYYREIIGLNSAEFMRLANEKAARTYLKHYAGKEENK